MSSLTNLDVSKKSIKVNKTPSIPVRQTKTSKIRSERGNQLEFLKNNIQKLKENGATTSRSDISTTSGQSVKSDVFKKPISDNFISRKSVVSKSHDIISRTDSGLRPSTAPKNTKKSPIHKNIPIKTTQSASKLNVEQKSKIKPNLNKTVSNQTKDKIKTTVTLKSKPTNCTLFTTKTTKPNQQKIETKTTIIKHQYPQTLKSTLKTRESVIKNEKKTVKIQSPLRKSISAMHLKRVSIRDPTTAIFRSVSAVNVSETIDENDILEIPNFNTPMAKRRSVYNSTPMTIQKSNKLSPWSGCWSPTAQDLKRRLSVWMEKNRKPYNSFNHLRCFGMHYKPSDEENKENVNVDMQNIDSSYEDLKIIVTDTTVKCDNDMTIANEALDELHKLVLEGYPVDQCEAWLDVIRTRFEELEDEQKYWECMAAIDKARGTSDTVYDEDNNDSYIENLLQKFNVLNLTPSTSARSKQRRRTDLNNSNIFKSTAINFSVKESSKKDDKKFLVTPIKRSTRQSTAGKQTPGMIVCSTLDELDSSVRSSMHFRTNKALKK